MTAEVPTGLRSVVLRRVCLVVVAGGIVWNGFFQHDVEDVLAWWLMLLVYGLLIAGAVQHVYRNVRVGRAETAAMIATTVVFVLSMLLVPRQVGAVDKFVRTPPSTDPAGSTSLLIDPAPSGYHRQVPVENSPLLHLFGRHPSEAVEPWLTIALVLGILTMLGVCLQWVLVWRLGRGRGGVFDEAVGAAGLNTGATLDPPLGTSVTRPALPPTHTSRRASRNQGHPPR